MHEIKELRELLNLSYDRNWEYMQAYREFMLRPGSKLILNLPAKTGEVSFKVLQNNFTTLKINGTYFNNFFKLLNHYLHQVKFLNLNEFHFHNVRVVNSTFKHFQVLEDFLYDVTLNIGDQPLHMGVCRGLKNPFTAESFWRHYLVTNKGAEKHFIDCLQRGLICVELINQSPAQDWQDKFDRYVISTPGREHEHEEVMRNLNLYIFNKFGIYQRLKSGDTSFLFNGRRAARRDVRTLMHRYEDLFNFFGVKDLGLAEGFKLDFKSNDTQLLVLLYRTISYKDLLMNTNSNPKEVLLELITNFHQEVETIETLTEALLKQNLLTVRL